MRIKLLFLFFISLFFLTITGHYGGDGAYIYETAESIIVDHDVIIGDRVHNWPAEFQSGVAYERGPTVCKYGIGTVLVQIPFYAVGHLLEKYIPQLPRDYLPMFLASTSNAFLFALLLIVFFVTIQKYGVPDKVDLWLTLALGITTPLWTYTRLAFREMLMALLLLLTIYAVREFRQTRWIRYLWLAGLATGWLIATKEYNAIVLLPLVLYGLFVLREQNWECWFTKVCAVIVPLLGWGMVMLAYNHARYGSWLNFGLQGEVSAQYASFPFYVPIIGFLISTGRGLLWYAPVVLLAIAGLIILFNDKKVVALKFKQEYGPELWLLLGIVVLYIVGNSPFSIWTGGHCWGPRYILPIIPLVFLLIIPLVKLYWSNSAKLWFGFLAVVGFLVQLPTMLINSSRYVSLVADYQLGDAVFQPHLSPILGNWRILLSAVQRTVTGQSAIWHTLRITNHDHVLHQAVTLSLSGYDPWDIWWVNILSLHLPHWITVGAGSVILALIGLVLWFGHKLISAR